MSQNSSQVKLTGWARNFCDQFFFLTARTQKLETGQKKLSITANVSIRLVTPKNWIARIFLSSAFLENFGPKRRVVSGPFFWKPTSSMDGKRLLESETYSDKETQIWKYKDLKSKPNMRWTRSGGSKWMWVDGGIWTRIGVGIWTRSGGG